MTTIFEGHPFLLICMGLLAPALLVRQPHFSSLRREWWLLPLLVLIWIGLGVLLRSLSLLDAAATDGLSLATWLMVSMVPFALLNRMLAGTDREYLELLLSLPALLFWGFTAELLSMEAPLIWFPAVPGVCAIVVLALMTGSQERFRRNRAPGSLAGMPFRLLILAILLSLVLMWETLAQGRLP